MFSTFIFQDSNIKMILSRLRADTN